MSNSGGLAVGYFQVIRRGAELYPVAHQKRLLLLSIGRNSLLAAIVGLLRAVGANDGEKIIGYIDAFDAGILALLDAGLLRRARVQQYTVELISHSNKFNATADLPESRPSNARNFFPCRDSTAATTARNISILHFGTRIHTPFAIGTA